MEESLLLSIVLPVYNVREQISVLLPLLNDFSDSKTEIVFVDDASTDGTSELLDSFVHDEIERGKRVRVVRAEVNQGIGTSRNVGVAESEGKYLWFVDPDDLFDIMAARRLRDWIEAHEIDLLQFSYRQFIYDTEVESLKGDVNQLRIAPIEGQELFRRLGTKEVENYPWAHICRTALYKELNVEFPTSFNYEDVATTFKLFLGASKCFYTDFPVYFYRQRATSVVHDASVQGLTDFLYAVQTVAESTLPTDKIAQKRYVGMALKAGIRRTFVEEGHESLAPIRQKFTKYFLSQDFSGMGSYTVKMSLLKFLLLSHLYGPMRKLLRR